MVRRQLALTAAILAVVPGAAGAVSHRVAIGHYQWSTPTVNIDLGEHVTWYWVGPDTMHSVTGISANDTGEDSDKGINQPHHKLGDSYQLTFNTPGVYQFQCKLHSAVRGEIVVSASPGDPSADPDPIPALNVDLIPPSLGGVRLARSVFGVHGTTMRFALDQRALLDAELWRVTRGGRERYAGYEQWHGHVGYNAVHLAALGPKLRRSHRLRPGRYVAHVTATDPSNNVSRNAQLTFRVS